jgi:hypothetical protein
MNTRVASWWVLGLATLSGCGGNGATLPVQTRTPAEPAITQSAPPAQQPSPTRAANVAAAEKAAYVPVGNFTLICQNFSGGGHERQARLAKDTYSQATGRNEFFVFHDTDHSELLFGGYRTNDAKADPAEFQRAESDLKWLRSLKGTNGQPVFPRSLLVPLPTADPSSEPQWNIANLDRDKPRDDPQRMYWTLAIAGYTTDVMDKEGRPGDRKQMAVDAVRQARSMGIPAYYYHGPSVSNVCIGAWPRSAMVEQESKGASSKSESAANHGEDLIVSSAPLPDKVTKGLQDRGSRVVQPKIEVRDPDLLATWKRYPEYAVNDAVQVNAVTDPNTGKKTRRPQQSFLVEIPETQQQGIVSGAAQEKSTAPEPTPSLLNPMGPSNTGGQLRRIGQ